MGKLLPKDIQELKQKRKITRTTGLDFFTARAIEQAGIDIIGLDGPPMEIFFKGMANGDAAVMEEVLLSLAAVRRGAPQTFLMVPIPFGYASISHEETVRTAVELIRQGADAVKIEGGGPTVEKVRRLTSEGIPCVGHVGLDTLKAKREGFHSTGKKAGDAYGIYQDAIDLQEAGVLWIELECVTARVAAEITNRVSVPTIGIGSGGGCDGQFLHCEDLLGMHNGYYPKHCKKYAHMFEDSVRHMQQFKEDVEKGIFPDTMNTFKMQDIEFHDFLKLLEENRDEEETNERRAESN